MKRSVPPAESLHVAVMDIDGYCLEPNSVAAYREHWEVGSLYRLAHPKVRGYFLLFIAVTVLGLEPK